MPADLVGLIHMGVLATRTASVDRRCRATWLHALVRLGLRRQVLQIGELL